MNLGVLATYIIELNNYTYWQIEIFLELAAFKCTVNILGQKQINERYSITQAEFVPGCMERNLKQKHETDFHGGK